MSLPKGKRWLFLYGLIGLLLIGFIFRAPVLRAVGNYLIVDHKVEKADAIFVLSGGALERGEHAASLFKKDISNHIVVTGENLPNDFKVVGIDSSESRLSRMQLIKSGVKASNITLLEKGTSTKEEAEVILKYCRANGLKKVVIVSTLFHTRRVKQVFKRKFRKQGIEILISGASSSMYNEKEWWKSEYGLLALNNEYVKQLYYLLP
jgi:uncharacterized SAM-binding protein YcdF (DUF218 family)